MPKLGSQQLNTASGFSFSGESLEDLGSDAYTLVCISVDRSYSTVKFTSKIRDTIKQVIEACKKHPKQNSILVRITEFSRDINEVIGYTLPSKIDVSVVDQHFSPDGSTALYDASIDSIESSKSYAKFLDDQYYTANAIVFVITDGQENASQIVRDVNAVKSKIDDVKMSECLDSIKTILIGLCDFNDISSYLQNYKNGVGFDDYINAKVGDSKTFAKLANFISQSVSSTSQALGTGSPSQSLTF